MKNDTEFKKVHHIWLWSVCSDVWHGYFFYYFLYKYEYYWRN